MVAEFAKGDRVPSAKTVVESVTPLARFYRQHKPNVEAIAVDAGAMKRIIAMLDAKDARGFSRQGGEVYFDGFRIYVPLS